MANIPINAILKGRDPSDILNEPMRIWQDVKKQPSVSNDDPEEAFSKTLFLTGYRIYLLGVEDGMKGE